MNIKNQFLLLFLLLSSPFAIAKKILIFGDFGTNDANQDRVASDMIKYCQSEKCDFAITTGDNIYPNGVDNDAKGPKYDLIDKAFVQKYKALNMPIYMSFGNHDVGNEGVLSTFKNFLTNTADINKGTQIRMINQLAFSNNILNPVVKNGVAVEERPRLWVFPAPYYSVDIDNNLKIWAIDTNSFPHEAFMEGKQEIDTVHPNNNRQITWLDDDFDESDGKWKIVFGHQPLYSHGVHGQKDKAQIESFRNSIVKTLCDNNVDFYISGHDHHLEIDKHYCAQKHVVNFILSGAAAKRTEIKLDTFPSVGKDNNLVWANGILYDGKTSAYAGKNTVLGYTILDIVDKNTAKVSMRLSSKDRAEQAYESCFEVKRNSGVDYGNAIKPVATCGK